MISFEEFFKKYDEIREVQEGVCVAEIAGRDSIAAIIRAIKEFNLDKIYPTALFHMGLYGDNLAPRKNLDLLLEIIQSKNLKCSLEPLIFLDITSIFNAAILRNLTIVQKHYEFYNPCVPCHLLLHFLRIPIAKHFKTARIITGERELHDKIVKLNQKRVILDLFKKLLSSQGIELIQPVRNIVKTEEISVILDDRWSLESEQFHCIFSGSYLDEDQKIVQSKRDLKQQINSYYAPFFLEIVNSILRFRKSPNSQWISSISSKYF